jgi:hypothetical protein
MTMTRHRHIVRSQSELGDQVRIDAHEDHAPRGSDANASDNDANASPAEKAAETRRADEAAHKDQFELDHPDIDEGYMLTPPRKQSGAQQLAPPGYIWNGLTQELIAILPEDHPDYLKNQEILIEATRRWKKGK